MRKVRNIKFINVSVNGKDIPNRSIILCVLRDACHELFCVVGDFYASVTQDAEVTKSLP